MRFRLTSPAADTPAAREFLLCNASPAPNATTGNQPRRTPASHFHTLDGARYWDERAYYAFTLDEIEQQIEAPTGEIHAMCLELVKRAMNDESVLRRLRIPQACWRILTESWRRGDTTLYGRFDFSFSGHGPAKLLEYNADTPTSLFEAAVFQWTWLEQAMERQIIPKECRSVQFHPRQTDRALARDRARMAICI